MKSDTFSYICTMAFNKQPAELCNPKRDFDFHFVL